RQRSASTSFAVLFLDVDRFKLVNDSLGHAAGDELLLAIAARLQASVASVNTVGRLGGDEFTLLLEDVQSREEVIQRVKMVLHHLAVPFSVAGQELRITASIGIALSSDEPTGADELLRDADIAMYQAKTHHKGGYRFFEPAMYERRVTLLNLQRDLRQAVEHSQLRVYYQPILRLSDQVVMGVEALVRWQHPEHGMISPAEFIPLAEESGLICEIDLWVLREGCRQLRAWNAGRATPLTLSVNLSAQHFDQPDIVGRVKWVLAEEGTEAQRIHLEITESLLMADNTQAVEALRAFRALGVKVVVDDFGTGYSSLSYLQRFPLDGLKIDRSFVTMAAERPEVIQTIVTLGRTLNMHVVAEGLEEDAQIRQLREMECDFGQGYGFARPLPPHELGEFLRQR
ncbi:bifunctional diguanylate cyclase/phosphodiesterase, partial [Deinococcus sp. Leaf326]|uniref:putative bifunctional diguanylate cyclase/phosphodiesterase n=1 Tax=Deinococcus sp. Leaf326 TaxID=1736338 RepID=UPI000ADD99BD